MRLWWTEMSADNKGSAARTLPCLTMLAAVHACFSVKNNSGLWMFMLSLNNKYFIGSIYAGTESCGSATERSVPHRSLLYRSKRLKILLGSEMFFLCFEGCVLCCPRLNLFDHTYSNILQIFFLGWQSDFSSHESFRNHSHILIWYPKKSYYNQC